MFLNRQGSTINKLFAKFKILSAILIILLFAFSCSDQGCIEADDFGEYDTETLEVPSNNSAENCVYDITKSFTDASQGSGLKACFISGSVTIYDEADTAEVSNQGCLGLQTVKFKNICANQCIANCNANISAGSTNAAEPAWKSTSPKEGSRNGGVVVRPQSQIYIRAVGTVRLGDKLPFPDIFISTDDMMPQSKTVNWNNQNLDLKVGKAVNITFSGRTFDNSLINGGATAVGQVGGGPASVIDSRVYNAGRRLAAYIIPSPPGYNIDQSQPTEKAQFVNVPLLPDHNLWQCSYSGGDLRQSACSNKSYRDNGYPNVDNVLTNSTFPLTSDFPSTTLSTYGGMVRWTDDEVGPSTSHPFDVINCDNPDCPSDSVDSRRGVMVGDLSSGDVVITAPVSAQVSFKELLSPNNSACNSNIEVVVRDLAQGDIYYFDGTHDSDKINVQSSSWSFKHIPVEVGQQIVIHQKISNTYNSPVGVVSCDRALAMRFDAYKDIRIDRSGFVSFAMLGGISVNGCNIKARIINPTGQHKDINASLRADFYEYSDFNAPGDPLENLLVPALIQGMVWQDGAVNSGSSKAFVRKGQVIRFSADSWNGTWSALGGMRECGIGMAMRIEPRPALLCRGYGDTEVQNPSCLPKYNNTTNVLVGCEESASECLDQSSSTYYCPNQHPTDGCLQPVYCSDGVNDGLPDNVPPIPRNTRYNCSLGAIPSACVIPSNQRGASYSAASCNACSQLRKQRAEQSPYIPLSGIAQCYDLEEYKGKVANIPISGFLEADLVNPQKAKGATILSSFNGTYGNFTRFSGINKIDKTYNNNVLYQTVPPLNISVAGRLKFLFLDGADFYQLAGFGYSDNSPAGNEYTGSNGFKLSLSSALEFSNGEWLEAKLCQELPGNELSCKLLTIDPAAILSDQTRLVELNPPAGSSLVPVSNTPFYFDSSGNLFRSQQPTPADCVGVFVNDTYYCHNNTTVDATKIRLTFKIKDPEIPNCNTNDPTNTSPQGLNGILTTNSYFRPSDCVVGSPTAPSSVPKDGITVIDTLGNSSCVSNASKAGLTCLIADDNPASVPPTICDKEFRCVSRYANNSGKYYVTVRVKTPGSNISNIVNDVITPVIEVMDGTKDGKTVGQAERIYKLIIGDPRYQAILSICLVVMFTFYGFGYLIGVSESGASDIVTKLLKIGLIYLFVGPEGWTWFSSIVVKFFKDGTDYLAFLMASAFDNSPALQNAIQNSDYYDKSILFNSVDKVFGVFFSSTVQKKISALLFASIFGWAYLLLIYYGMLLYIYAVANSVLLYLTSQVFISILFVLGPLFFVFTLFSQTKEMFDKWLSQLISFSLQQIFLLTTLAFFNMMMYEVIKMVLGYKICWDEVWTIHLLVRITLMSFWTIASLPPRVNAQSDAGNIGNPDGIPSFFAILFIWVIADLMLKFVEFMTNMAASISGGLKASALGSGIKSAAQGMGKFAGARAGEMWDKTGGEVARKLDQSLFDSGKYADQARDARKQENSKMNSNKRAFADAGKDAISNYKKKNGAELAKMSAADQKTQLSKVRNEAEIAKGKKLGLSDQEISKVQKDKSFKYEGTNVFGAAYQGAKQMLGKGESLSVGGVTMRGALKDKEVSTKFSEKEAKAALKNTDAKGRADFVDAVKKGDVHVGSGGWEGAKRGMAGGAKNAAKVASLGIYPAAKAISKARKDSKDYDEAREQLVAEGVVPKMAYGTNSALPKELKDKIRARRDQNVTERNAGKAKISTDNTAAKMEQFAESYDEKDSAGDGDHVREESFGAAIIGREKTASMAMNRGKVTEKVKKERAVMQKSSLESKRLKAEEDAVKATEAYETYDAEVKEIMGDDSEGGFQEQSKDLADAQIKSGDKSLSRSERSEARQKVSAIQSDPKFKADSAKLKKATVARNQAFNQKKNYEEAINGIEDKLDEIEAIEAKSAPPEAAEGAADPRGTAELEDETDS